MPTKILKNRGVIFNDNDCQLGCQLLSMRETSFVWVGRATRRWQPKTKGIWWVASLFLRVVGLDGFRLDNHCRIATGERAAFGGDGTRDIAGSQSQCHRDGGGDSHCQVLDSVH